MLYPFKCVACLCLSTLIFEPFSVDSSPVTIPDVTIIKPRLPENICFNEALDEGGYAKLIEDCSTLRRFTSPPEQIHRFIGSNMQVCCPEDVFVPKKTITGDDFVVRDAIGNIKDNEGSIWEFPTEPPKTSIRQSSNEYYDYYEEDDALYDEAFDKELDESQYFESEEYYRHKCPVESSCSQIEQCSEEDFLGDSPPLLCGFDGKGNDKFCCSSTVKTPFVKKSIERKFGNKKYPCSDYHRVCRLWAKNNPNSCNPSHNSYPFMRAACMRTCNRCRKQGCKDEFQGCKKWKTAGYCVKFPDFMQFNCRETCGTCGFLSPRNKESQVVDGKDYSSIDATDFYCGEGKKKAEIFSDAITSRDKRELNRSKRDETETSERVLDDDVWTAIGKKDEKEENRRITCGSTIINDKFIVFAAHCETDFKPSSEEDETVRTIIVRDGTIYEEKIEIRRVFVHPGFKFPSLYDDIAVAELGRRIEFDYEKFGHSPSCLGSNTNIVNGKTAVVQGYGRAEDGRTSNVLREATVNVIGNIDCSAYLNGNITNNAIRRAKVRQTLPNGINAQLICSTGIENETTGVYTGPCEGDSGGPLFINYGSEGRKRQTLEGITSGGLSCGQNFPSWYTRVASYRPWILCIIRNVRKGFRKSRVEKMCEKESGNFEKENIIE